MEHVIEQLKQKLAVIDGCIAECNDHFGRLVGMYQNGRGDKEVRKAISMNLNEYCYLTKQRKTMAEKIENTLCEMINGW